METVGFIIGNSSDGSVLSSDFIPDIRLSAFIWNRGASSPRKSNQLTVQPAAPWCPMSPQRAGEGSCRHQLKMNVRLETQSLLPVSHLRPGLTEQQGLPHTDQELFLSWSPAGHSWSEMPYSMGLGVGVKPYMPICMEAQVALPVSHLLMQRVLQSQTDITPEDHVEALNCPGSST